MDRDAIAQVRRPLSVLNGNGQSRESVTFYSLQQNLPKTSFPKARLTAISHTVTALTKTSLPGEAIAE